MIYKGQELEIIKNGLILKNPKDFKLDDIFLCGQCFRWEKNENENYTINAFGIVLNIFKDNKDIVFMNTNLMEFKDIWYVYFDLETDYGQIKRKLKKDDILKKAIDFAPGIRILKQDPWEALISFIVSTNNNIPRIKKIIEKLSNIYGEKIYYKKKIYYTFPRAKSLNESCLLEINECRAGYRCDYILKAANIISEKQIDLKDIYKMNTIKAASELKKIKGVGDKVADCVLLFAYSRMDVFPVDVWIKKVLCSLYNIKNISTTKIKDFKEKKFGKLAGYAQQYLFYYIRENKII